MNIYLLDVSPLSDEFTFKKYYADCPDYRKNKIDSLKNEADRMRSLGAEIALAYGMCQSGASPYSIAHTPGGKPYAETCDIQFSLSHSGNYAAAALAESDIGIDIETPREADLKLAERYFSPDERSRLEAADDAAREFLRIWTRKESLLKAAGIGITTPLSDICVLGDKVKFNGIDYSITTVCEEAYILSAAVRGDTCTPEIEHIIVT